MDRRIIAIAAGFAAMVLAGAQPAQASQCTTACDQTYTKCDSAGGQNCLPSWGQCKKSCTAPTPPAKTTPVVATKPVPKPPK